MRVVVDLLFIRLTVNRGVQTYVNSLLPELAAAPGCDLTCVTNRGNHSWYAGELGLPCWSAPVSGRNRVTRVLYQQLQLGAAAQRLGSDVMFCPGYLAPAIPALPTVPVLHDMNFRDIPELFPATRRMAYNITARSVARRAAAVITASEFSKERIVSCLGIAPEKISVVHYGSMQIPGGPEADWPTVQAKYGVSDNYFLSVSSGDLHKNIRRLAQGFVAAQRRAPGGEQLVLVGHRLDGELEAWLGREGFGDAVVATGYVSEAEKVAFLRHGIAYFSRRCTKGLGCRRWRRSPAGCRWRRRGTAACRRSAAKARSILTRCRWRALPTLF